MAAPDAYGFDLDSTETAGVGAGGGVGAFLAFAYSERYQGSMKMMLKSNAYLDRSELRLHGLVAILLGLRSRYCVV